jgi:phosphatidylglycerophosphate synthase
MSEPVWDLDRAVKPIDSWWTVGFVDPIAMRVLPLLLRVRRATPNAVTGVAFVVGLASILLFATGHLVAGAVLYETRFVLDCLDGKIARVRRLSSSAGAMFDRVADLLTIPAVYATIGWWLAARGHLPARLALLPAFGAVLVAAVDAVLEVARLQRPKTPDSATEEPTVATSGIASWARRHRLTLRPWTVEAETLGLFLGPLLLRGDTLGSLELALAAVYAVFVVVDLAFLAGVVSPES